MAVQNAHKVEARQPIASGDHAGAAATLQWSGDIDGALALYRAILSREPNSIDTLRLFGLALARKGLSDEAEIQLCRCLTLAPDFVFAWNNLGSVLYERDRLDEAIDASEHAIALDAGDAQSHFNLGNALAAMGAHARATQSV
jgi:tetratricopeptide (TPR) repeat protein